MCIRPLFRMSCALWAFSRAIAEYIDDARPWGAFPAAGAGAMGFSRFTAMVTMTMAIYYHTMVTMSTPFQNFFSIFSNFFVSRRFLHYIANWNHVRYI